MPPTIRTEFASKGYTLGAGAQIKGEGDNFDEYDEWTIKDGSAQYIVTPRSEYDPQIAYEIFTGRYELSRNLPSSVACNNQNRCMTGWEHKEGEYIRLVGSISNADGVIVKKLFHLTARHSSGLDPEELYNLPVNQLRPVVSASGSGFRVAYQEVLYPKAPDSLYCSAAASCSGLRRVTFSSNGELIDRASLTPDTVPFNAAYLRSTTFGGSGNTWQFTGDAVIYKSKATYNEAYPDDPYSEVFVSDAAIERTHNTAYDPVRQRTLLVYERNEKAIGILYASNGDIIRSVEIANSGYRPHAAYDPLTDS